MIANIIALLWGIAEATFFFIVPDVWLTFMAKSDLKKGIIGSIYSLFGSLIGGTIMYYLGAQYFNKILYLVENVPAINEEMIAMVNNQLIDNGVISILLGPLKGIPYKIFAIHSSNLGITFVSFLLISIPARWIRFVLVAILSHYLIKVTKKMKVCFRPNIVIAIIWCLFYVIYFVLNPG